MNIYQRVNEVRKAVAYVRKDKRVGEGGYLAVTHDAVTALVREHLIAYGVVIVPNIVESSTQPTGTSTAKGVPFIRYEARYRFDVVNTDDPVDRFSIYVEAHAIDQGDKAPGKAFSYAKKYAMLKLLEIESGEEEENRETQVPAKAHKPTDGAMESLSRDRQRVIAETHAEVRFLLEEGKDFDAFSLCETISDADEKVALWGMLDAKSRARIKAQAAASRKKGEL
jgi:hypothetical protein